MTDNGDSRNSRQQDRPPDRSPDEDASGTDEWLAPFFTDSSLWPVVLVVAACLSTLGSAVLVAAVYHQNVPAAGALLGLAWMSLDIIRRRRREHAKLGMLGWSILTLWALCATVAAAAISLGLA